jgi:hypothetical protein
MMCKTRFDCHPEEPRSDRGDEGSPQLVETATAEILRFAQNDTVQVFSRNLISPVLADLKVGATLTYQRPLQVALICFMR